MGVESILDGSYLNNPIENENTQDNKPDDVPTGEIKKDEVITNDVVVDKPNKGVDNAPTNDVVIPDDKPATLELNNENVLEFINKDRENKINSYEDLFKTNEVKEVNPYDEVFDEADKAYFKFKKDTGLGRKEFDFVQQDFSKKSIVELAHDFVRKENKGTNLTKEQINAYLEKKLDIDLDVDDLDGTDQITLNAFVKPHLNELNEQQNKYRYTEKEKTNQPQGEMLTLENGSIIPKSKYEELVKQDNKFKSNIAESVSSATSFQTELVYEVEGEKKSTTFNYDYGDNDKHSMLSSASNLEKVIMEKFKAEDGGLDHKKYSQFVDQALNFNKYMSLAYNQGRSQQLEEKIASDNNEVYKRSPKSIGQNQKTEVQSILDLVPGTN